MGNVFINICYEPSGNEYCAIVKTGPNFLSYISRYNDAALEHQCYSTNGWLWVRCNRKSVIIEDGMGLEWGVGNGIVCNVTKSR